MEVRDQELQRRVRDIIAVVSEDIDAVTCEVEQGVAYIEGVVPSDEERRMISQAVRQVDGLTHVITCLATERVIAMSNEAPETVLYPTPVMMHYHSLS